MWEDMAAIYRESIEADYKAGQIKENTYYGYCSYFRVFDAWLAKRRAITHTGELSTAICSQFLDYMQRTKGVSIQTRNNYRGYLSVLCEWMKERGYIAANPVTPIKKKTAQQKKRVQFTAKELKRLHDYFAEVNPRFLFACEFAYYTLIRPIEMAKLRVRDIDIDKQEIFVSASISKSKRDSVVGINNIIRARVREMGILDAPPDWYIFGNSTDFAPCPHIGDGRTFRDYFLKHRAALGLSDAHQFYSLKDSGIRDLANAYGIVMARDQARHTDITTTNKYLTASGLAAHEETKKFRGAL